MAGPKSFLSRRRFLLGAVTAPVLAALYAWRVEPVWVEFVERDLPIAHLPPSLAGRRLVQLSDLHIGRQVDDDYLVRTFKRVTALAPDFVVHTGDLLSYAKPAQFEQARRVMAHSPRGRLGTAAVLGNHDYGRTWTDRKIAAGVERILAEAGATVLRNARVNFAGLELIGIDDFWSGRLSLATALAGLDSQQPVLTLCHNPDACDLDGWDGFRGWILAGHTHGGQCKPPFLPPPLLPVRNRRYSAGEIALSGGRQLYINRGVGHLLRVRFNVRPEVTVFRLTPA